MRQGTEVTGSLPLISRKRSNCPDPLLDDYASRASLHLNRYSASADFAAHFFASNRALHGHRMRQINRPRTGVRVQIERCILRKAKLHAA